MSLLDLSPEIRGEFLKLCGYGSGRTCQYQSHMEPQYSSDKLPDVRPDGLIACVRGATRWSGFIEAKAGRSPIRPEQIVDYIDLAAKLDVDVVISISNEFARSPQELPYHVSGTKLRKTSVCHFAWADIRTFLELQSKSEELGAIERKVLSACLMYFWEASSGILTYDAMPADWPKFVEASHTQLGFGTKTQGITEIVHGWQQERRDLCSKIIHETHADVVLGHHAGSRADAEQRLKVDRKTLADEYVLTADYVFRASKVKLKVQADLKSCQIGLALEMAPPENKKARAVVNWFAQHFPEEDLPNAKVAFDWKGRKTQEPVDLGYFLSAPDMISESQKDAPRCIRFIRSIQDVRRFKSRKKFIEDLERLTLDTVKLAMLKSWI